MRFLKTLKGQLTILMKNVMTGAMAEKNIFLPISKTIMMNLMQSWLENIMKGKVLKKRSNLPVYIYIYVK